MSAAAGLSQVAVQNNQSAQIKVMDQRELNLQNLQSGLNNMSDRFFINGKYARQAQQPLVENNVLAGAEDKALAGISNESDANKSNLIKSSAGEMSKETFDLGNSMPTLGNPGAPTVATQAATSSVDGLSLEGMTPIDADGVSAGNIDELISSSSVAPESAVVSAPDVNPSIATAMPNPLFGAMSNEGIHEGAADIDDEGGLFSSKSENGAQAIDGKENLVGLNSKNINESNINEKDENGTDKDQSQSELKGDNVFGRLQDAVKHSSQKSFTIEAPKATAADMQSNVNEIISQAQFLAKKGGGEMKVSLNPDGLGEVNLKVKMTDGRLNVEMVTSNSEVKHLLERGLGDLKENLALHKLHLDSVKIDSPKDLSQHMDQNQNGDRGLEQRFLSDFMEQNNGFRRDMMEFGAPSRPDNQRREYYSEGYGASSRKKADSTRRLDLVA